MQASQTETEKPLTKQITDEEVKINGAQELHHKQKKKVNNELFICAGNTSRDFGLVASNIDDIIEEEEEDYENKTLPAKSENEKIYTNTSNFEELPGEVNGKVVVILGENTKFTLEPVVLEGTEDSLVTKNVETTVDEDTGYNNVENNYEDGIKSRTGSVEIRVEEGYATRQMDEFFRQTIAQIKEELTKKLENNNADEDEDIGDFSDDEESYYDDEFYEDDDEIDDMENQKFNIDFVNNKLVSKPNRILLYQQLMSENRMSKPSSVIKPSDSKKTAAAWMVFAGCVINMVLVEGVTFNYINFFEFVEREFDVQSKLVATMPAVILLAVFLFTTPLAVILAKLYGSRKVAIVGSVVSTVALILSSFQENIVGFIITYGCLNGLGISLIYIPSLICLSKWFLKDRLWACGTMIVIVGGGSASYPIFTEYIISRFGNYASLLILAAVQFNCLVGSFLLIETGAPYSLLNDSCAFKTHKLSTFEIKSNTGPISPHKKTRSESATQLTENESGNQQQAVENPLDIEKQIQEKHTREYQFRKMNNLKRKSALRRNLLIGDETRSNVSSSTATTVNNYTLKQYWRKFVQTRQDNSKAKKNLFHLIAEEKKKTRTMSKSSLEDGFVITTSNNLLAPNDEENVIIFERKATLLKNLDNRNPNSTCDPSSTIINEKTKTATSRFLTRFANSVRSMTKSTTVDIISTNEPVVSNLKIYGIVGEEIETPVTKIKKKPSNVTYSDKIYYEQNSEKKALCDKELHNDFQSPKQLISVFNPSTDDHSHGVLKDTSPTTSNTDNSINKMPANLASVFTPLTNLEKDLQTNLISSNEINFSENNSDEEDVEPRSPITKKRRQQKQYQKSSTCSDYKNNNNEDDDEEETPSSYIRNFGNNSGVVPNSILKTSRYLGYRSSLSNSVRGSLMECTVPENDIHNEQDNNLDSASVNFGKPLQKIARKVNEKRENDQTQIERFNDKIQPGVGLFSLTFNHQLMNARRFVSTIDASGFINHPVNLETPEYNLRNSLIKKNSESYRRNQKSENTQNTGNSSYALFIQYMRSIICADLLLNPLLSVLNLSFLFSTAAVYTIIVYFYKLCQNQNINHKQTIYLLFLIVFIQGLSRLFAIILFRCNESTIKSRIFTYNLTLVLMGLSVLAANIICDTVFSLTMFAIVFGSLYGFNANLKTTFIYDILGLNWSDDCLFAYNNLMQGLGVMVGLTSAGALYDYTDNHKTVLYFSGASFILSALILLPGKKLVVHFSSSYKLLNRFFFLKK